MAIAAGQIALARFPQADLEIGKTRPVLLITSAPGNYNDWLVCMLSSQLHQAVPEFDEILTPSQNDYRLSGLNKPSVLRISRLAVINATQLLGKVGQIDAERLRRVREKISAWISPS